MEVDTTNGTSVATAGDSGVAVDESAAVVEAAVAEVEDPAITDAMVFTSDEMIEDKEADGSTIDSSVVIVPVSANGAAGLGAADSSQRVALPLGSPLLNSFTFSHILATCGSTNSTRCALANNSTCFIPALMRFNTGIMYGLAAW